MKFPVDRIARSRMQMNTGKTLRSHLFTGLALALISLAFIQPIFSQERDDQAPDEQETLLSKLKGGDEEQRLDATARLGILYFEGLGVMSDEAMSVLLQTLQDDQSPVVRALAAHALELSRDTRVATSLVGALQKERQIAVRKAIVYALARYPSSLVSAVLEKLLKDKQHEIRAASAFALAETNDPLTANALIEFMQKRGGDQDSFARAQAARGLGRLRSREAVEVLLKALTRDKTLDVRREAARALGQIALQQDPKVLEALQSAVLSEDPYLALAAEEALKMIKSRI